MSKPPIPPTTPQPGFYYHYKHKDDSGVFDYAYEVLGYGFHSEDDCAPRDVHMVVYRPLYPAFVYTDGKGAFDLRPLSMFMEDVDNETYKGPRFRRITDQALVDQMEAKRKEMYGA
jgi:hypothetical protein